MRNKKLACLLVVIGLAAASTAWADPYNDGYRLYEQKKYADAAGVLKEGLSLSPEDFNMSYLLAVCLSQLDRCDEAIEPLRTAIMVKPEADEAHSLIGSCYMRKKEGGKPKPDWFLAGSSFQKAAQIKPDKYDYNYYWGLAKIQLKKYTEALQPLRAAVQLKPDDFNANYYLGVALERTDKSKESIPYLAKAHQAQPNEAMAMQLLASVYLRAKDFPKAEAVAKKYVAAKPEDYQGHNMLGTALLAQKKSQEAIKEFQEVVKRKPDMASAHLYLGQCLQQQRNFDGAISAFQQASKLEPNKSEAIRQIGLSYELKAAAAAKDGGDCPLDLWNAAKDAYERALAKDKNNEKIMDRIEYVTKKIDEC